MKRYRIGLMVGTKSIDYVHSIRMGVQNTLEETGHTLIAISDLIPFHSRVNTTSYFRVAFEVAARLELDAVIVPAGIIAGYLTDNHTSLPELLNILDRNRTLVIEREIEGYRCVSKDNKPGMHACMRHLIYECGFKKIAFIGGPESSTGAREREEIYYQEMEEANLDTPPRLIAHGEFSGECGDSIERLIDENDDLEAIACCCDLIAHSVYAVMRRRHLQVGRDIAVTGFDDHAMSAHLDPPLSTVRMTGYDLGCAAAREAILICEGKPQQEPILPSTFIVRGSCGEDDAADRVDAFMALLTQTPFPTDGIVDILMEATLSMAGRRITEHFRAAMTSFLGRIVRAYQEHVKDPELEEPLFSSQDLALLFSQSYRSHLSLEGFQSTAIAMLRALSEVTSVQDTNWIIRQIANLHLGISRMLNIEVSEVRTEMAMREWTSFHVTDDALRQTNDIKAAYRSILGEFKELGVRQADLFLLPEPVSFIGLKSFALSDTLIPIGRLAKGKIHTIDDGTTTSMQALLGQVIPRYGAAPSYTVGGIMAGNELMGVAALDPGTLDDDGQLIAFLNLGVALKFMQMIANERESNVELKQQSHYDEMTGVANRRGFMNQLLRFVDVNAGKRAALFYLDLDGLKTINDNHGHDSGDEAIRKTTRVLSAVLPPDAILARMGGDEFVAITVISDERDIEQIGRSVEAGMATFNATHHYPFTLSISYGGVSLEITPSTYENINKYLIVADEHLYEMKKRKGRGRSRQPV